MVTNIKPTEEHFLQYVLSQKHNGIVKDFIKQCLYNYDIHAALQLTDICKNISHKDAKSLLYDEFDGSPNWIFAIDNDNIIAIFGRKPEYEMEDNEEYSTVLMFGNVESNINKFCKTFTKRNIKLFALSIILPMRVKQGQSYSADRYLWEFEKKQSERLTLATIQRYVKAVHQTYETVIKPIEFENVDAVEFIVHYKNAIMHLYNILYDAGWLYKLNAIDISLNEYEFNLDKNLLFIEIKSPYTYFVNNIMKQQKYVSLYVPTKRVKFTNPDITLKQKQIIIAKGNMLKALLGFAQQFQYLFKEEYCNRKVMTLNNVYCNGIYSSLMTKLHLSFNVYNIFVVRNDR